MEVLEDRGEQTVRVHARDARGRAGHGLRHVHQDSAKVSSTLRADSARRERAFHRGDTQQHQHDHMRSRAASSAHVLRGRWLHDLGANRRAHSGSTHREVHAIAQCRMGLYYSTGHKRKHSSVFINEGEILKSRLIFGLNQ